MNILQINHSDNLDGGSARAAYRIHQSLRQFGIDSCMWVNHTETEDYSVQKPSSPWHQTYNRIRLFLSRKLIKTLKTKRPALYSPNFLPSRWPRRINESNADLVNLHWIAFEMMSIEDMARINKPTIWTLHDMWAFCGAEHLANDSRFKEGYLRGNRPNTESGFDLNRWTWKRKLQAWKNPIHIITPSHWLADCVTQSFLMRDWPVSVIPNALDVNNWKPVDQSVARSLLGIPEEAPTIAFGAFNGTRLYHKGADLLFDALNHLRGQVPDLQLIIFGESRPEKELDIGFPIHYLGNLHDDLSLKVTYSAADAMIVPSRQEAFGQTASEAHACGTPVVCFNTCGLPDIVTHKRNGWLAKAFDSEDLATGILWILEDSTRRAALSKQARNDAVERFAYPVISQAYLSAYERVLKSFG